MITSYNNLSPAHGKPLNGGIGVTLCWALVYAGDSASGAGDGRLVDGRNGRGEHCY